MYCSLVGGTIKYQAHTFLPYYTYKITFCRFLVKVILREGKGRTVSQFTLIFFVFPPANTWLIRFNATFVTYEINLTVYVP